MSGNVQGVRTGLPGFWDRLVGSNATVLENAGTLGSAALGAVIGAAGGNFSGDPGRLKRVTAAVMGADLIGGIWANATPTARRLYHGRGQGTRENLAFSAVHLHPFLVAALYRERDWHFALTNYVYMLTATAIISKSPAPYRLAVALALYLGAVRMNSSLLNPTPGLEWFAPVYFLKLLVSHAAGQTPEN